MTIETKITPVEVIRPTIKRTVENLNGKRVRKVVHGALTVEDIPTIRQQFIDWLAENNMPASDLIEDDLKFTIKGETKYRMKPKLKRLAFGTLQFYAREFTFTDEESCPDFGMMASFAERKGIVPMEGEQGFTLIVNEDMRIIYTLEP